MRLATEDMRVPPHLTSRISTAANSLIPGSSSLNQSRMDKSAERIATYITVYGRKSSSYRSSRSSRTSFRTQKSEDPPPAESRPVSRRTHVTVTAAAPVEQSQQGNIRSLVRQSELLREEICRAMSDRLDLYRDLAGYEHLFARQITLSERLKDIQSTAESLPEVMYALSLASSGTETMLDTVRCDLDKLSSLKQTQLPPSSHPLKHRTTGLRTINTRHHITNQYRGCIQISGIKALIQISSDLSLEHFRINAETLDGQGCSLVFSYSLGQELPAFYCIRDKLIPYLHFTSQNHHLALHFNPHYGVAFRTIIARPRGFSNPLCFYLIEDDSSIRIRSDDFDCFLSIPLINFTDKNSLSEIPSQEIISTIQKRLFLKLSPNQFLWLDTENAIFASKEKTSKLMDAEYLSDKLGDFILILMAKEEITVDGMTFVVELYAHKAVEKIRIVHGEHFVDVEEGSRHFAFIKQLQFRRMHREPKAVFRSLEMMTVVRTLFINKGKT